MQLRDYQRQAIAAVENEFNSGVKSTLMVLPTGTGKTFCFTELAKRYRQKLRKPTLVLAHRAELIDQAAASFHRVGMHVEIEKAESRATGKNCDAVIASVQSISQKKRLESYPPNYFGFIVTDESHHSIASTYRKVFDHFDALHLGVTATPSRFDEIGLKNIYESCAFQYSIQDAIKDGYLVPIRGQQIEVAGIHLEQVKVVAGEFSQPEMDAMLRQEETLQGMVLPTLEAAGNRPTIVFTPGVEHAHDIAACFNRLKPGSAVAVDGGMNIDERRAALGLYESGKRQFIVNVQVLTEGYDHPPTACIALFRPTRSLGLFAQMIGRGTRLFDGKSDCIVLDFVGVQNTVRTITVMDVLDGTVLKDAEHKKAQELQARGIGAVEALAEAKQFVAGLDSIRAKMKAFSTSNAFDVLGLFSIPNSKGLYGGDKATAKQISYLEGRGVKCSPDLEKGEASKLIDKFIKRQDAHLATWKQLKYLKALGVQDGLNDISFEDATAMIDRLVKGRKAYA